MQKPQKEKKIAPLDPRYVQKDGKKDFAHFLFTLKLHISTLLINELKC